MSTNSITRPALSWPALQVQTIRATVTPRSGLTLADYGTITLTVRSDPLWNAVAGGREGLNKYAASWADPIADGWLVAVAVVGIVSGSVVTFTVPVPSSAGAERYAFDIVALGGAAGRVQLRNPQWLTVTPTLKA